MAFKHYLEEEDDKPYFTTNSLGYYYDKMEGFAEKVEQAAKTLNVTKEEVEKNITAYIEQNKNELDQRLAQWDGKLETFDSSVETLLSEWVDDGTLTHVIDSTLIDQKVAPLALQLADKLEKGIGSVEPADLSQAVKEQMTGGSVAVVGKNSVLTENIVDKQVSPKKTTFINQYPNLFNKNEVQPSKRLAVGTGGNMNALTDHSSRDASPIMDIEPNKNYTFGPAVSQNESLFFVDAGVHVYDANGIWLEAWTAPVNLQGIYTMTTANPNARYARFNYAKSETNLSFNEDTFMFVEGTRLPAEYVKFGYELNEKFVYPNFIERVGAKEIGIEQVEDYDSVRLFAPLVQNFVAGEKGEIFNYGIVENDSDDEIRIFWKDVSVNGNGKALIDFTSNAENTSRNAIAQLYDKLGNYKGGALVECRAWKPIVNPETAKNILMIGDSLTYNGVQAGEFKRRLTSTDNDAYGLNNFNFVGRVNNAEHNVNIEALGGREWTYYSKDNPTGVFYDSATADINVKKYMETYCGDVPLHYVSILLGMNDMLAENSMVTVEERVRNFISKVNAAYPDCKILLHGFQKRHPICYTEEQYDFNEQKRNIRTIEYSKLYEKIAEDYAYVYFVNNMSRVDIVNNSRMATQQVNLRNPETTEYVMDFTHPETFGYLQYADHLLANFFAINQS